MIPTFAWFWLWEGDLGNTRKWRLFFEWQSCSGAFGPGTEMGSADYGWRKPLGFFASCCARLFRRRCRNFWNTRKRFHVHTPEALAESRGLTVFETRRKIRVTRIRTTQSSRVTFIVAAALTLTLTPSVPQSSESMSQTTTSWKCTASVPAPRTQLPSAFSLQPSGPPALWHEATSSSQRNALDLNGHTLRQLLHCHG